jgi:hypothetical protein
VIPTLDGLLPPLKRGADVPIAVLVPNVVSNFTATPVVSGATCSLFIVLASLSCQGLAHSRVSTER